VIGSQLKGKILGMVTRDYAHAREIKLKCSNPGTSLRSLYSWLEREMNKLGLFDHNTAQVCSQI
jgi:hypothetical protein